jgi:hypothetical protein
MDAHEAEELANSMMRNSPLPDPKRSEVKLPEDDGSKKLPKEGGGEKLPEESPIGKPIVPFCEEVPPLVGFITQVFSLDSRNPGNAVRRIEEALQKAVSVVQATTSQVSTGSALPQEKLKLAYKLLGVSSRLT